MLKGNTFLRLILKTILMFEWLKTSGGVYNLTLVIALVAWLISGIGIIGGFHLNKVRGIESERKASEARDERDRVRNELLTTQEKLATAEAKLAPRVISEFQRSILTKSFNERVAAGKALIPIIVCSKMLDPESADFAAQIFQPIAESRWESVHNTMGALPFSGIRLVANGDEANLTLIDIRLILHEAGIDFAEGGVTAGACPLQVSPVVYIFVGQK